MNPHSHGDLMHDQFRSLHVASVLSTVCMDTMTLVLAEICGRKVFAQ